jgi:hypothetical protein
MSGFLDTGASEYSVSYADPMSQQWENRRTD